MQLFCKVRHRKHFFRFSQQQLKKLKKKKKLYTLWSRSKIHTFTTLNILYTYFPHVTQHKHSCHPPLRNNKASYYFKVNTVMSNNSRE